MPDDAAGKEDRENEEARAEMHRFEQQDVLPSDPSEWPDGRAKHISIGDDDDQAPYGEGVTAKLGPELVHNEDGSVTIDGEKVDNPEDYKGEPIQSPIERLAEGRTSPGE